MQVKNSQMCDINLPECVRAAAQSCCWVMSNIFYLCSVSLFESTGNPPAPSPGGQNVRGK